jgi:hypothetical protein
MKWLTWFSRRKTVRLAVPHVRAFHVRIIHK